MVTPRPGDPRSAASASGSVPLIGDHPHGMSNRSNVLPFVPDTASTVLDVGCSRGRFCALLKATHPEMTVWGIEPHPEAAAAARLVTDRVILGSFPDDMTGDCPKFDVVFFCDVLEHVTDPWTTLRRARELLAPGGCVIASIPNVRHWTILRELVVRGDFTYTESGLLDRTHLRFFTRKTMLSLFEGAGYEVASCEPISMTASRKVRLPLKLLPTRTAEEILARQFVVTGRPSG